MFESIKNFTLYWTAFFYSKFICTQIGRQISIPIVIDGQLLIVPLYEKIRQFYPDTFYKVDSSHLDKQIRILLKYEMKIHKKVNVVDCETMEPVEINL
jgi:hypothetical protein